MFPPCQLSAKLHSDYMKKRDHTPWHPHSNLNVFYSFSAFLILLQGLSKVLFHYSTLPFLDDPWNAFDKCRVLQRFFLEICVLVSFCSMNNFIQRKSAQPNIHHEAFKGHIHSGGGCTDVMSPLCSRSLLVHATSHETFRALFHRGVAEGSVRTLNHSDTYCTLCEWKTFRRTRGGQLYSH